MAGYLLKRLMAVIPVWLVLSILAFSLLHLAGGSPAALILGVEASPQKIVQLNQQLGLTQPLPVQYLHWLVNALHGDFGRSYFLNSAVLPALVSHFAVTVQLTALGLFVALVIGVPLGVFGALGRDGPVDWLVTGLSSIGFITPEFLMGLMLILVFAVTLPIFPPEGWAGFSPSPGQWLTHILMPTFTLGFIQAGPLARFTRTQMLRVLRADYVRTARAKGLGEPAVVVRHALASALLPLITAVGLVITALIGGAFVTETVFALPGLGELLLNSALHRDFPVLQGGIVFVGTLVLLINLGVDLLYAVADPQVRYE